MDLADERQRILLELLKLAEAMDIELFRTEFAEGFKEQLAKKEEPAKKGQPEQSS